MGRSRAGARGQVPAESGLTAKLQFNFLSPIPTYDLPEQKVVPYPVTIHHRPTQLQREPIGKRFKEVRDKQGRAVVQRLR